MTDLLIYLSGLITIIVFLFTSRVVFNFFIKINLISESFNPYTNKKMHKNYWEFSKIYFFGVASLVFFCSTYWQLGLGLLIIGLLQAAAWLIIIRAEHVEAVSSLMVEFDEKDREEYLDYLKTIPVKKRKKIVFTNKIVLHGDTLYWGKRKKVLIKEKRYKYIFMNSIDKRQRIVILRYGFLGLPLFKKEIYIPARKDKKYLTIHRSIEQKRQVATFIDKYKNVFRNSEKN